MKLLETYYFLREKAGLPKHISGSLKRASILNPFENPEEAVRKEEKKVLKQIITVFAAAVFLGTLSLIINNKKLGLTVIALCFISIFGIIGICYEKRKDELEKRRQDLEMRYSELASEFSVLVGAGFSIRNAWEKMVRDYKKENGEKSGNYLYNEMLFTWKQIERGISEEEALLRFGERISIPCYMRFVGLLEISRKNGNGELKKALSLEAREAFSGRIAQARKYGDKIQVKLLVPMMILFVIVLSLLIIPAFLSW